MPFDDENAFGSADSEAELPADQNRSHGDSVPADRSDSFESSDGKGELNQKPAAFELPLKFLHPMSLIFDLLAHVRSYLLPLGFGLYGAANGNTRLLIISAILFVPAVVRSTFRYFTLRYRIEDAHLIVDQGLVFRKTRSIPVHRIQNIDLTQNVLHRIFKVAEVKIETASGTEAEAVLRVLSMEEFAVLRQAIFAGKDSEAAEQNPAPLTAGEYADALPAGDTKPFPIGDSDASADNRLSSDQSRLEEVWRIPLLDLVKAGLASNRGLVMLGIGLVSFDQFFDNGYESVFAFLTDHLPADTGSQRFYLQATVASVIGLVLLRLVGIVWYLLRFYDYRLVRRGGDLRVSCGLLTRVSATVPRKRIQFISVQQNLIMRWFRVATIRIETAGGATDKSKPSQSIAKTWFVPVMPTSSVRQVVNLLRPDIDWTPEKFDFHGLAPRASTRMVRLAFVQALLLAIGVAFIGSQFTQTLGMQAWMLGGVCGVLALPALIIFAKKKAVSRKYTRLENAVVYRTGVFGRKTSVTFFDKLQNVACFESPFDRRWKMATLAIDTAAAGPAGHQIITRYLDAEFAKRELEELRCLAVKAAN